MRAALHVRDLGPVDGRPTFVLLHAGVADARGWIPVAELLVQHGCRVLAPDLRGFGSSPDPDVDFRHADDVLAMLDERGITDPVAVVGWSMSGTPALALGLDHPDRVATIALVCSVPGDLPRSQVVLEAWEREEALFEAGDLDGMVANDVQTWGAGAGRTAADLDPALVAHMEEVARDLIERDQRATGQALDGDRDAMARLETLRAPLLVITADLDTPCHEVAASALVDAAPHARRVQLPGAAHMAPMELPVDVAELLLAHAGTSTTT